MPLLNLRQSGYALCVSLGLLLCSGVHAAGDRIALIIGNSAYKTAPLVNPKNDAAAMTKLLNDAGFEVQSLIDGSQADMQQSVAQFGDKVRQPQAKFALFYYAGHGVQLDWRNYLIPVNANVATADDVRKQAVDVSELAAYMNNQKNKSFLMILDACRDDPFADRFKPPAKGLSQFDAPTGSMLAYATAPGKVAMDGQGNNGLYTSYLIQEMSVKTAKLEDVFKRVRLSVRLASNGMQVPWETTSLEEDVYLFPGQIQHLSEAEQEQVLQRELTAWARVKDSQDHIALANFIRQYPSGSVSELAQSRLSRLLTAQATREVSRLVAKSSSLAEAEKAYQDKLQAVALEAAQVAALRDAANTAQQERNLAQVAAAKTAQEEQQRLAQLKVEQEKALFAQREAERLAAAKATDQQLATAQREAAAREAARDQAQRVATAATEAAARDAARQAAAQQAAQKAQELNLAALARESQQQADLQAQARKTLDERLAAARAEAQGKPLPESMILASPEMVLTATPYFVGLQQHQRRFSVGDEYTMRVIDSFNKSEKPLVYKVTAVNDAADRVEYNGGEYASDVMGNLLRNLRGSSSSPRQFYPAELTVGKRWTTMFTQEREGSVRYTYKYDVRVVGKERVTVPAGTFEAYRIEARGFNMQLGARIVRTIWVAPGINPDIAHDYKVTLRNGQTDEWTRTELTQLQQKDRGSVLSASMDKK